MAPIKHEEQMKDKLEKRSLQPSPDSWSTLANRLNAEEEKKNKTWIWWIGIAASIVGILFVTTMYFNNQPIENGTQIIVDTKENVINENQKKFENEIIEVPIKSNEVVIEELKSEKKLSNESGSNSSVKAMASEKSSISEKLPKQNSLAQTEEIENKNPVNSSLSTPLNAGSAEKPNEIENAKLTFENQKVQDVVAQINNLKSNGNQVSDGEIDSLLKKAQKEILSNRLYNENTRTVDANALLRDVEEDLQQSFRSKVFEALQSGYESVKTAVAERNN